MDIEFAPDTVRVNIHNPSASREEVVNVRGQRSLLRWLNWGLFHPNNSAPRRYAATDSRRQELVIADILATISAANRDPDTPEKGIAT